MYNKLLNNSFVIFKTLGQFRESPRARYELWVCVGCTNNINSRPHFSTCQRRALRYSDLRYRFDIVPSAPPQNVACAALNGQNIQVTWKPPPSDKVHGVVLGYKLLYEAASDSQTGRETKVSHALSTVLHTLSPYTNYTVQVLAYTRAGDGVASSPVSCTTGETGKWRLAYSLTLHS